MLRMIFAIWYMDSRAGRDEVNAGNFRPHLLQVTLGIWLNAIEWLTSVDQVLIFLPQEIIEHDLHIIPVYLDRGLAFFGQADQGAGDTVDKFLLDADITGIF